MNEDIENKEQKAFEDWYRTCNPYGDCEQVHSQWLESSEYEDFCIEAEDQVSKCARCNIGTMKELSIYDDWEGMLTCDKCGVRIKI